MHFLVSYKNLQNIVLQNAVLIIEAPVFSHQRPQPPSIHTQLLMDTDGLSRSVMQKAALAYSN